MSPMFPRFLIDQWTDQVSRPYTLIVLRLDEFDFPIESGLIEDCIELTMSTCSSDGISTFECEVTSFSGPP